MIRTSTLHGFQAVWLQNDDLRLVVLPEKGADIPLIFHERSGVQFLMVTPQGLKPPSGLPAHDFLENYEGGWQELFPNGNDACTVKGVEIPFHGEVALLPWEFEIVDDDQIHLQTACRKTPFLLERWMRLEGAELLVRGRVTNRGAEDWPFTWGQHLVLGGDFLEDGCVLEMPASTIQTPAVLYEPETARLAEGQIERWPMSRLRQPDQWVDLRQIPGPQARSHDDAYITGFSSGRWLVTNPRLGLRLHMIWDAAVYPWVVLWMPYGGADLPPLTGIYGLGIEPWISQYPLSEAIATGQARTLGPGQSLETSWRLRVEVL